MARLAFIALWCEADKEGRLVWKPKTIKLRYFPADDCDISELAQELHGQDLIHLYEADGKQYCWIPGFQKHQVINNRERESELPAPKNQRVNHASGTRESGREGKGREGNIDTRVTRDAESRFARFWEAYPRKRGKGQAEKAWKKLNPNEQLLEKILQAIERAKTSDDWQKDNGQYIPHPGTWLNAKGWEDEFDLPQEVKSWHETASGIREQGFRHGLTENQFASFYQFKQAVFAAEGVTA